MSLFNSIEPHWCFVPLVILFDPGLSIALLPAFTTDSSGRAICATWTSPLSFIELHWSSAPLVILVDPLPSMTLQQAFKTGSGN
jgi:hypothetical protein